MSRVEELCRSGFFPVGTLWYDPRGVVYKLVKVYTGWTKPVWEAYNTDAGHNVHVFEVPDDVRVIWRPDE